MPDIEQKLIIKAISEGFSQISKDMKDLGEVGKKVEPPPEAKNKWTELASQVGLAKQAFGYVQQAGKAAYQELERGAALTQAQSQFENLAGSIGTTADSIDTKLKAATSGMMSQAERMAGASQIISLGLASNETDVVRLAKATGTLGLDMQQVILTFANNSKARLDSLGLSVQGVTDAAAELDAQGFKGDSFDEAVLRGLEDKMVLLGDASETTAGKLKILNSVWEDTHNAFSQSFAEGAADSLGMVADNADDVSAGAQKLASIVGGSLSRTFIDFFDRAGTGRLLLSKMGEAENEAADGAEKLAMEAASADKILQNYATAIEDVTILAKDQIQVNEETGLVMRGVTDEYRAALRVLGEHSPAVSQDTREMEDAAYASGEFGDAQKRLTGYIEADKEALAAETKAMAESIARKEENARITQELASATGDYFTDAVSGNNDLYNALTATGNGMSFVSNLTGQQADDLARLQDAYDKAAGTIHDYEIGLKGANLEDDARNKKIEEQQVIMDGLSASMQPLLDAGGEYVSWTRDGSAETDALNQLLYEAADAAGADAEALASLMYQTGDYTKEQINMALQTAAVTAEAQRLGEAVAAGTMTVSEATSALQEFANDWTASATINTEESKFRDLLKSLIDFDGKTFRATADVSTSGSVPSGATPSGATPSGATPTGKGGAKVPEFATGGTVPGPLGSPQLILAHGGETVTPPGQNSLSVVQNFYGSSPNTMIQARDGLMEAARAIGLTGYA